MLRLIESDVQVDDFANLVCHVAGASRYFVSFVETVIRLKIELKFRGD